MRGKLAPVAERMRGREDLAPFIAPAALLEDLNMVIHVFPIDGDIPAIGDVTDRRRVAEILCETLPDALEGRFTIRDCQVELAHYGRQHRCTLRYTLDGTASDGSTARQVVYGKVAADGSGERTIPVITELRERLAAADSASRINIPRVLAFRPDLQLLLLEAIPGKPQVARLLKARLAGEETTRPGELTLEDAIAACGRIAAAMHTSGITLGRRRTLDDEMDWSDRSIQALGRVSPDLGARLQTCREQIAAYGRRAEPLAPCFSHGDFTYTQLIFDGAARGLVDFDTVCQAEPALDLGQFLAYQRLAILKDQRREAPMSADATEQLCARFLDAYFAAARHAPAEEQRLRARAHLYESLMLLRLAVHSWQKLKISRLAHAITLLEERIACLP
jgi:Ser/Thr protein kinase RdoA (MazF antagonist)